MAVWSRRRAHQGGGSTAPRDIEALHLASEFAFAILIGDTYRIPRPPASDEQLRQARALKQRINEARLEADMGLEDLARRAGVNRRTLDKYFEGESPSPSFFLIAALTRALGMRLDDLARVGGDADGDE